MSPFSLLIHTLNYIRDYVVAFVSNTSRAQQEDMSLNLLNHFFVIKWPNLVRISSYYFFLYWTEKVFIRNNICPWLGWERNMWSVCTCLCVNVWMLTLRRMIASIFLTSFLDLITIHLTNSVFCLPLHWSLYHSLLKSFF